MELIQQSNIVFVHWVAQKISQRTNRNSPSFGEREKIMKYCLKERSDSQPALSHIIKKIRYKNHEVVDELHFMRWRGGIRSGAKTNLKVGAPVRRESGGTCLARSARYSLFRRAPPRFGSKSTIIRHGERCSDSQYSLVSFLFAVLLLTLPPVPRHF